ncbi:MJ1255/VC2487 family glycosyltransferase [Sessilibacter sp. MAH4]
MKILYGVQGTGNGHITRARALSAAFSSFPNIEVDYLFSGRDRNKYFDMQPFNNWQCLDGLTFVHKSGKIDPIATVKKNRIRQLVRDIKTINLDDYDLILTDFEPITAWSGKRNNKPVIGVGHQYAFDFNIPKKGENLFTKGIMRNFAPAKIGLGLHWHHFGYPILPPIADIPNSDTPVAENKVLVYLGFEDQQKVIDTLRPISDYEFYFYGEFDSIIDDGNLHLRPLSREGFKSDLKSANAVICNAGFELVSEALELGKKVLVKPLHGQMEQLSNAEALKVLGLGSVMEKLNTDVISKWLSNQPNLQIKYPNVAAKIVEWISEGEWTVETRAALVKSLWESVQSPDLTNFATRYSLQF